MKKQVSPAKAKAKKKTKATSTEYRICKKCSAKNPVNATECKECASTRLHPSWVKKSCQVNRAISVAITGSNPAFGEPQDRITLNKFSHGIKPQNFNITNPEHWIEIKRIIDENFGPELGWKEKSELITAVKEELSKGKTKKGATSTTEIDSLVQQYPQFTDELMDSISKNLHEADFEKVHLLLETIAKATSSYDEVWFASLKSLFEKLKTEDSVSITSFAELLKDWNLKQITDVTKEVKRRLLELDLFMVKIQDEKTYEIRGDDSIHRILERSMWLVDEKYWIIQSNKQLRTFIGDEMAKEDKKYEKDRPDFACGDYANTILIIEIKRPSHSLLVEDLDQLLKYLMISKKYLGDKSRSFKAMLIGNSISTELEARMEWTRGVDLLTYNELVQDCKKRYSAFLKHIAKN